MTEGDSDPGFSAHLEIFVNQTHRFLQLTHPGVRVTLSATDAFRRGSCQSPLVASHFERDQNVMSETKEPLFDLTLTEEQRMTRESLHRFAADEVRAMARAADEEAHAPPAFFETAAGFGLHLMPVPEHLGGAGVARSPLSGMLNAEDLGYGDVSLAIAALTPVSFINVLLDEATPEQQERFLPALAVENFVAATIAVMEPRALFDVADLSTVAERHGEDYVLTGVKTAVALADGARYLLVLAKDAGNQKTYGFVVPGDAAGLRCERESYMGLRSLDLYRVTLDKVSVQAVARIGDAENGINVQRIVDLGRIGLGALAVGCCQAMLDYVVPYVNDRTAFGEPISHRQSVAFMVADMAIELDAMRMLVYRAASRADQGRDFHRDAYQVHLFCGEKAMQIGTNGVQLLGGHGFVREHPVEMWYRNLRAIAIMQGLALV